MPEPDVAALVKELRERIAYLRDIGLDYFESPLRLDELEAVLNELAEARGLLQRCEAYIPEAHYGEPVYDEGEQLARDVDAYLAKTGGENA